MRKELVTGQSGLMSLDSQLLTYTYTKLCSEELRERVDHFHARPFWWLAHRQEKPERPWSRSESCAKGGHSHL